MNRITLTDAEAEAFADIRMRLIAIAGPHLWPDLLIAIVDDYLERQDLCDPRLMADNVPGWLLDLPRQGKP